MKIAGLVRAALMLAAVGTAKKSGLAVPVFGSPQMYGGDFDMGSIMRARKNNQRGKNQKRMRGFKQR
jgi:hypothetical protein